MIFSNSYLKNIYKPLAKTFHRHFTIGDFQGHKCCRDMLSWNNKSKTGAVLTPQTIMA